jgi:hypothetical protein
MSATLFPAAAISLSWLSSSGVQGRLKFFQLMTCGVLITADVLRSEARY